MDITATTASLFTVLDQIMATPQNELLSKTVEVGNETFPLLESARTTALTLKKQLTEEGSIKIARDRNTLEDKVHQVIKKLDRIHKSTQKNEAQVPLCRQTSHTQAVLEQCLKSWNFLEGFLRENHKKIKEGPSPEAVIGLKVIIGNKRDQLVVRGEPEHKEYIEKIDKCLKMLQFYEELDETIADLEEELNQGEILDEEETAEKQEEIAAIQSTMNSGLRIEPGSENEKRYKKLTLISRRLNREN